MRTISRPLEQRTMAVSVAALQGQAQMRSEHLAEEFSNEQPHQHAVTSRHGLPLNRQRTFTDGGRQCAVAQESRFRKAPEQQHRNRCRMWGRQLDLNLRTWKEKKKRKPHFREYGCTWQAERRYLSEMFC